MALRSSCVRDEILDVGDALAALGMNPGCLKEIRLNGSISYNELNYKLTFAVLRELMEPDEFLLALEALNRSGGAANTAKRVIRNIYVLDNILRYDKALTAKSVRVCLSGNMCPLDTIVTMNSYFRASRSSDCEGGDLADFLRRFSSNCISLVYLPSHRMPAPLRKQLYLDIGFDERESRRLLLANSNDFGGERGGKLHVDSPGYVTEMARRLRLLRKNSEALQLGEAPCTLHRALSNWNRLLKGLGDGTGVPTVIHSAHSSQFLLKNNNISSDEYATEDSQHEHKKAPLCKVLSDKFGLPIDLIKRKLPYCKWNSKQDIVDGIVPARRPSQILLYLEGRGFSQAQIVRGLPLLMYPLAAVEAAVARAAADFPSDRPDSAGHFLALALYSLEREDEFSGDLIIEYPQLKELTEDLKAEIETADFNPSKIEVKKKEKKKKTRAQVGPDKLPPTPDFSKKPLNPYLLFFTENKSDIWARNPNLNFEEISKKAAQIWRESLDPKKKDEYIMRSKVATEEFHKKKASHVVSLDPDPPKIPRKPIGSYLLFFEENKAQILASNPDMDRGGIHKMVSQIWRESVDPETKAEYTRRYKEAMKEYNKKKADYEGTLIPDSNKKPFKPTCPSRLFFSEKKSEIWTSNPSLTYQEVRKKAGQIWRESLDPEEKAEYITRSKIALEEYQKKNAAYEASLDPDTPKRPCQPMSAFLLFFKENKEEIKASHPTGSIHKKASQIWRETLDPDRKAEYTRRYEEAMKQYQKEMAAYKDGLDSTQ